MNTPATVILGSGMAGYALAREFRKVDATSPLELVTADDGAMYSKPMLSNAFAQQKQPDALVQKSASQAAQTIGVTIHNNSKVVRIDRTRSCLELADGQCLPYAKLVLAVGAQPRPFPLAEGDASIIETVNSLDDYRRWHNKLVPGARVLIIGAGLIGSEFANDLAGAGFKVVVVDPMSWPLGRLLPEQAGLALHDALHEEGVDFHLQRTVKRIRHDASGYIADLDDGASVGFDHALSAIGLLPNTRLAREAGLAVDAGIVVDAMLRTSDENIFAIGDCAQTAAGILPYVLPLMAEARALARTLTGTPTPLLLPALPVVVKTPALPIAVCPPRHDAIGDWHIDGQGRDLCAIFRDADGNDLGFALTGARASARQGLAREMPALLSA